MGADRLRDAGRLVERGLRIGEQPAAVRLAGVVLDADRVDDEEEPAARSIRPRIGGSPGTDCGAGRADAARREQATKCQDARTGDDEVGEACPFHVNPF